tara:strand:- start:6833 stop:7087 length:255 start_codon:yes stop_codon:yes gene_type:complete
MASEADRANYIDLALKIAQWKPTNIIRDRRYFVEYLLYKYNRYLSLVEALCSCFNVLKDQIAELLSGAVLLKSPVLDSAIIGEF